MSTTSDPTEVLLVAGPGPLCAALDRVCQSGAAVAVHCSLGGATREPTGFGFVTLAVPGLAVVIDVPEWCEGWGGGADELLPLGPLADRLWHNRSVTKVFWDCRADLLALRSHGVNFNDGGEREDVVDAQLLDVLCRGETEGQTLDRLAAVVPRQELSREPHLYAHVHKLNNLSAAMREHGLLPSQSETCAFNAISAAAEEDEHYWLERPLPRTAVECAADSAQWTLALWQKLSARASPQALEGLGAATRRYFDFALHTSSFSGVGVHPLYRSASLLPLEVLEQAPHQESSRFAMRLCAGGCRRTLPAQLVCRRSHRCHVCRALAVTAGEVEGDRKAVALAAAAQAGGAAAAAPYFSVGTGANGGVQHAAAAGGHLGA